MNGDIVDAPFHAEIKKKNSGMGKYMSPRVLSLVKKPPTVIKNSDPPKLG